MANQLELKNWKCIWHPNNQNRNCKLSNTVTGQNFEMCNKSCKDLYETLNISLPTEIKYYYTGSSFIYKSLKSLFSTETFNPAIPIFYPFEANFVEKIKIPNSIEQKGYADFLKNDTEMLKTINFVIDAFINCGKGQKENLVFLQHLIYKDQKQPSGIFVKGLIEDSSYDKTSSYQDIIEHLLQPNTKILIPIVSLSYDEEESGHGSILYMKKTNDNIDITYMNPNIGKDDTHDIDSKFNDIMNYCTMKNIDCSKFTINKKNVNQNTIQGEDRLCYIWSFFSGIMCVLNDNISIDVIYKNLRDDKTRYFILYLFLYYIYLKIRKAQEKDKDIKFVGNYHADIEGDTTSMSPESAVNKYYGYLNKWDGKIPNDFKWNLSNSNKNTTEDASKRRRLT